MDKSATEQIESRMEPISPKFNIDQIFTLINIQEPPQEEQNLTHVLRVFTKNPFLISKMPVLFPPEAFLPQEEKDRQQLARRLGFESFEEFATKEYSVDQIFDSIRPSINLCEQLRLPYEKNGMGYNGKTSVNLAKLIEAVRFEADRQIYAEHILQEAKSLLQEFLPAALPKEKTRILIYFDGHDSKAAGRYGGRKNGTHFISLTNDWNKSFSATKRNTYREKDIIREIQDTIVIIHELNHQKFAEETGIDHAPNFLTEGVAVATELFVITKNIKKLEANPGRTQQDTEVIEKLKSMRLERIRIINSKKPLSKNIAALKEPYALGYRFIRALYKRFGLEKLPEILRSIDIKNFYVSMYKHKYNYEDLIGDPSKIPGLEKYFTETQAARG